MHGGEGSRGGEDFRATGEEGMRSKGREKKESFKACAEVFTFQRIQELRFSRIVYFITAKYIIRIISSGSSQGSQPPVRGPLLVHRSFGIGSQLDTVKK